MATDSDYWYCFTALGAISRQSGTSTFAVGSTAAEAG